VQETRQRILTAAVALFEERGFAATTVDDIAAAAQVSRRTFFYHFPTKEDAVLVDHDDQLARLLATVERQPPEVPAYEALWVALIDLGTRFDRTKALRLRHELVVNEPLVHARSLQLQSRWDHELALVLAARLSGPDPLGQASVLSAIGLACLRSCAARCVTDRKGSSLRTALVNARAVLDATPRLPTGRRPRGAAGADG
jgi:AcrR family transcriptional regulator